MERHRTERGGVAMWKIFGHTELHACPECRKKEALTYYGFAKNYMVGSHAKIYQCGGCEAWIDVIWERFEKQNNAGV